MERMLSSIMLFAGEKTPEHWLDCNGTMLQIGSNQELFSLLSARFGGNGRETFALPKLPKVGDARYIICVNGRFPSQR